MKGKPIGIILVIFFILSLLITMFSLNQTVTRIFGVITIAIFVFYILASFSGHKKRRPPNIHDIEEDQDYIDWK